MQLFFLVPLDHHLDYTFLALSYELECIFCLVKRIPIGYQSLYIDFSAGDQVHGSGVTARSITDGTTDGQIPDTRRGDRKNNILDHGQHPRTYE